MTPEGGKLAHGVVPGSERVVRTGGINTGRLRLVPLGERAVALVEDDAVVDEIIAGRDM
jgi:hypothetical protein